ncbi:dTMP kinase [Corynebacterium imitans]|uniref:dTMP kinase n=1 Tax=Corynebacterium imitans TaxID=156978 RepID=UPI00254AECCF|nr:dTMP kinase [Corynebacterium imitans]MDK8307007.1 dTMP kinase [Corynebacterium imitans]MDK8637883.1 dTMP kinase [Corynebacterium imitans]MDK8772979.1 dTMP kinase [Corynebacterium imitans]
MIIAVEGIDGAGKRTIVQAIQREYGARTLAFPRYEESIHAQLAQQALHGKMGDLTDSIYGMATMFALDRYGANAQIAEYAETGVLVLDRYVASNAAYSWARSGEKAIVDWVADLEFSQLGLPVPDLQVLVDTPPAVAQDRALKRAAADATRERDRYERDASLQQATYEAYVALAEQGWASRWLRTTDAGTIMQAVEAVR